MQEREDNDAVWHGIEEDLEGLRQSHFDRKIYLIRRQTSYKGEDVPGIPEEDLKDIRALYNVRKVKELGGLTIFRLSFRQEGSLV